MALTVTEVFTTTAGTRRMKVYTVAFDASYATGGEALTKQQLGFLYAPDVVIVLPSSGFAFEYDKTNEKVKAFAGQGAHTHTENTNATYVQNATTGAVTAGTFNVGRTEVANTTDLSAVTGVVVIAIGKN